MFRIGGFAISKRFVILVIPTAPDRVQNTEPGQKHKTYCLPAYGYAVLCFRVADLLMND